LATEQQEEKPAVEETDPSFKVIQEKLDKENVTNYTNQFDQMVHSPEWKINGDVFHYQIQSHKRIEERRKLEAEDIDEIKDWTGYVENYFKRSELLIQEMTREKFDELPFYTVENLVTAWSVRSRRGFCD